VLFDLSKRKTPHNGKIPRYYDSKSPGRDL